MLDEEKHFGRAAQRCHVSQPTLSIGVKKLEKELDAVLFERTPNWVKTTPAGERVVEGARKLLEQATQIEDSVRHSKDPLIGPLALGVLPSIGPYLLPRCIPILQRTARHMPLCIEQNNSASLAARLRGGDLDVVVAALPFSAVDVVVQPLFDEPFVVLLPSRHPLALREILEPAELAEQPVLMTAPGCELRHQILGYFPFLNQPQTREQASISIGNTSVDALRHMVASGMGLAIVPATAAQCTLYSPDLLVVRPFAAPEPGRTLVLAWRAGFPRHGAVEALRSAILMCSGSFWAGSTWTAQERAVLVDNNEW